MELFGIGPGWWGIGVAIALYFLGRHGEGKKRDHNEAEWLRLTHKLVDRYPDPVAAAPGNAEEDNLGGVREKVDKRLETGAEVGEQVLLRLGIHEYNTGRFQSAIHYWKLGLAAAKEAHDVPAYTALLMNLGSAHYHTGNLNQSAEYLRVCKVYIEQIQRGTADLNGRYWINMALDDAARGKYDAANKRLEKAIPLFKDLGNQAEVGHALANIGRNELARQNYEEALTHTKEALQVAQRVGDKLGEASAMVNAGLIACEMGDEKAATEYSLAATRCAEATKNENFIGHALSLKARVAKLTGNFAEAVLLHEKALSVFERIENRQQIGEQLGNIGLVHKLIGDKTLAINYLKRSLSIMTETGFVRGRDMVQATLIELES